jgi:hypothetical protein
MASRHTILEPGTYSRDRLSTEAKQRFLINLNVAINEPTLARKNGLSAYNQYSID